MSQKFPLLMVDSCGDMRTVFNEVITRIMCPYTRKNCNKRCSMLGMVDNGSDLPGLVCRSHGTNVPLGLADPETFDLDLLERLRAGTDLFKQINATKEADNSPK